jgi:hypothetical protein
VIIARKKGWAEGWGTAPEYAGPFGQQGTAGAGGHLADHGGSSPRKAVLFLRSADWLVVIETNCF